MHDAIANPSAASSMPPATPGPSMPEDTMSLEERLRRAESQLAASYRAMALEEELEDLEEPPVEPADRERIEELQGELRRLEREALSSG